MGWEWDGGGRVATMGREWDGDRRVARMGWEWNGDGSVARMGWGRECGQDGIGGLYVILGTKPMQPKNSCCLATNDIN